MLILTFVRPIDLVDPLNISGSFYNTTIIKQITSHMGSRWVPIYPLPVPYPCFEFGENSNSYSNPIKMRKTDQIGFGSGG